MKRHTFKSKNILELHSLLYISIMLVVLLVLFCVVVPYVFVDIFLVRCFGILVLVLYDLVFLYFHRCFYY